MADQKGSCKTQSDRVAKTHFSSFYLLPTHLISWQRKSIGNQVGIVWSILYQTKLNLIFYTFTETFISKMVSIFLTYIWFCQAVPDFSYSHDVIYQFSLLQPFLSSLPAVFQPHQTPAHTSGLGHLLFLLPGTVFTLQNLGSPCFLPGTHHFIWETFLIPQW